MRHLGVGKPEKCKVKWLCSHFFPKNDNQKKLVF